MAKEAKIILNVSTMPVEDSFSGEKCTSCGECVYGPGFRIVVTTSTERNVLPQFKESNIILCVPCKEAMK
jgi:hypothetical protein